MKYIFTLLLFVATNCLAQKTPKVNYYMLDGDWNAAKDLETATYVLQASNIGDTIFIDRLFKGTGRLWRQESFKDKDRKIAHGQFGYYDEEGRLDSTGYVNNGKKSGTWTYYDDTLGIVGSVNFESGKEVYRKDYVKKIIVTAGREKTFAQEKAEKDSSRLPTDTFKLVESEAKFKGGVKAYTKYLQNSIQVPTNIQKTGNVKIQFLVNKQGKPQDLLIMRSLQLSADVEVIRVLSEMPDWSPAMQNGKPVFYQAIQVVTFQAQ